MSDPRPDAGPPSLAHGLYGPDGPVTGGPSDPQVRAAIDGGQARPRDDTTTRPAPLFGGDQNRQPSPTNPAANDRMFDVTQYQAPDGVEIDPAIMGEFGEVATDLGLRESQAKALLAVHHKAMAARTEQHERAIADWRVTSERDYGAALPRMVDDITAAVGKDADARRFYEMLEWSGLSNEPTVLKVLHRLATGRY